MRQRHLLGKFDRQKYVEKWKLLSGDAKPSELFMLSTDFPRTIQSGYSQLSGLYPEAPHFNVNQKQKQVRIPFKVRRMQIISE